MNRLSVYFIAIPMAVMLLGGCGGGDDETSSQTEPSLAKKKKQNVEETRTSLSTDEVDYNLKRLGKYVFFDKISEPKRMACVTCHDPNTGWTGSNSGINLHQVAITGANPHTAGNIKPPSAGYASFTPLWGWENCNMGGLRLINENGDQVPYCGGNFWNGRATGKSVDPYVDSSSADYGATRHIGEEIFYDKKGDLILDEEMRNAYAAYFGPTTDQALNPMPNPVEQNIARKDVCELVKAADFGILYEIVFGADIDCSDDPVVVQASDLKAVEGETPERAFDISFKRLMLAVGAYEHSGEVNSFSSKRDIALYQELACLDKGDPRYDESYEKFYDQAVCNDVNFTTSPGEFPLVGLTTQENLGHDLFYNSQPPGQTEADREIAWPFNPDLPRTNCSECHSQHPQTANGHEPKQTYTKSDYHNLGLPYNPEIPNGPESGVSARGIVQTFIDRRGNERTTPRDGFFRTPTLRNVDRRKVTEDDGTEFIKAYMHNGWHKSLESVVHWYNTAAVDGATAAKFGITRCPDDIETEKEALENNCWPASEFPGSVVFATTPGRSSLVGDLNMTVEQETALVAYLKALSDTYVVQKPQPYKHSR